MPKDKSKSKKIPPFIHDRTFHRYGRYTNCIIPLVKLAIGDERTAAFDWNSATLVDTRLVPLGSKTEYRFDMALCVTIELGASRINVFMVIEHKSGPDPRLLKQLLRYQNAYYQDNDDPMVVIVCYHGQKSMASLPSFQDSLNYGDTESKAAFKRLFGDQVLDFHALFVNMPKLAEGGPLSDAGLECMFYTMTHIFNMTLQKIKAMYVKAARIDDPERQRDTKMVSFDYINSFHPDKYTLEKLKEMERELEPDPGKRVLTDFESWDDFDEKFSVDLLDRGIEQGIEQGIEKTNRETVQRMLAKGYGLDEICSVTNLSREEVEEIRNQSSG